MKQPKTVTTRVWVSRDCDFAISKNERPYAIWKKRPRFINDSFYEEFRIDDTPVIDDLCVRGFHELTGLRLKPGECRQVDMTITMVPVDDKKGGAE